MTRDHDSYRIRAIGGSYRADGLRCANCNGNLGVTARFSVRYGGEFVPDALLKCSSLQVKRQVEAPQIASEVGAQLASGFGNERIVWVVGRSAVMCAFK